MILQKRKGIKVSNTRIRRFVAKTGIWNAFLADEVGAEMNVKTAHAYIVPLKRRLCVEGRILAFFGNRYR
jgi:hypothetical protein